jgi:hypothetical protein
LQQADDIAKAHWSRVQQRRAEYEPWTDQRLTLDTSIGTPETLLAEALDYLR